MMPHFYDYQGNAICEACSEQIPEQRDGPHQTHWFQCQECKKEFDTDDSDYDAQTASTKPGKVS